MVTTSRQNIIINLLRTAGEKIMEFYHAGSYTTGIKDDGSPVTAADTASEDIIKDPLASLTGIPVISEESAGSPGSHHPGDIFWLLDPLDGTSEFIKGNGEFCICLALVEKGNPVEGYIYSPVSGDLWFASAGMGAFRESGGLTQQLPLTTTGGSYRVLLSRSHHGEAESEWLDRVSRKVDIETATQGSAIKFGMIAEGSADLYIKKGRIFGWDVAAGAAILKESRGGMLEIEGSNEPSFMPDDRPLFHFLAYGHRIKNPLDFIF